ncbi:MAG: hypothetical protein ACKOT0_05950 [bacterium]
MERAGRVVAAGVAVACLAVAALLLVGAWRSSDDAAVDDLPSVDEVVAAQAHRHGITVPELSEDEIARLSAPPTAATSVSAYDQVLPQLQAVKDAEGVDAAMLILGDAATVSPDVTVACADLYSALAAGSNPASTVEQVCPAS